MLVKVKYAILVTVQWSVLTTLSPQSHFSFTDNTGNYEPIYIGRLTLRGGPLDINDEIGVFDNDLCVGAIEYTGQLWDQLAAWHDDNTTEEQDGFVSGNPISFRFWDASLESEIQVEKIEFLNGGSFDTSGVFNESAWARVNLSALIPQEFDFTETSQYQLIQLEGVSLRNLPLLQDTEIGILGNGITVGAGIYSGESSQQLFAWANDTSSSNQDGFFDGDSLSFYYHDETGDSLLGPLTFNYSNNPEWNSSGFLFIETISGVTLSTNPQITLTPQETMEDSEFNPINLSQIVSDPDDDPVQIMWSFSGNEILNLNVENNFLSIEIPVPDWYGTEIIQFIATDSNDGTDSLIVPFIVLSENDSPVVSNIDVEILEDNETIIILTGNDVDGDELTITLITYPEFGLFELETNLYSPFENYHGTDTFTYNAFDGELYSNEGIISIIINPVNDIPFSDAGDDLQMNENATIQLYGTGGDIEGDISFQWSGDSLIQFIDPDDPLTELISPEVNTDTDFIITLTVTDSSNEAVSDSLILTVFDLGNTDIINLNPNWNIISFDIMVENMPPETVFADIIDDENLVFITGYDSISYYFDPLSLPFLNTLNSIDTGSGYWIKVVNQDEVIHTGIPIPADFNINLRAGWNLIGYWLQGSITPEDAFTQLITDGNLIYVTAFGPNGATFFEPGGNLNTLGILENGYGYWLKIIEDVENFQYPSNPQFSGKLIPLNSNPAINKTNVFMYINGTISCTGIECENGTKVNVFTDTGLLVGELLILEEGFLQTGAVYGNDPTTKNIDGALLNQPLNFVYKNQTIYPDEIRFNGNMELKKINLVFDSSPDQFLFFRSFPNPFNSTTTIQFNLGENPKMISTGAIQIYNLRGNLVKKIPFDHTTPGNYSIKWNGMDELGKPVPSGVYFCKLEMENIMETLKLVLLN